MFLFWTRTLCDEDYKLQSELKQSCLHYKEHIRLCTTSLRWSAGSRWGTLNFPSKHRTNLPFQIFSLWICSAKLSSPSAGSRHLFLSIGYVPLFYISVQIPPTAQLIIKLPIPHCHWLWNQSVNVSFGSEFKPLSKLTFSHTSRWHHSVCPLMWQCVWTKYCCQYPSKRMYKSH